MEAYRLERPALAGLTLIVSLLGSLAPAAEYRTTNFAVSAPTEEIARQVAEKAEDCRRELALAWLGRTLPNWFRPCPVRVQVGQIGAGGATTFTFDRGEVSGWNMRVQGTLERILDSVIPHEVSHTIFASHFRRPLPRWADEGAATLIEHVEEQKRQDVILDRVIHTSRRIPLKQLLTIAEYPSDMQQVYTLYAEGYSLANYLVQQRAQEGKAVFLQFLQDAHEGNWTQAIREHYGLGSVAELETKWTAWVTAGSPPVRREDDPRLADSAPAAESAVANPNTPAAVPATAASEAPAALALASLPPLPPLARQLREVPSDERLNAPQPGREGAVLDRDDRTQSSVTLANAKSTADRIVPRRDPAPGFNSQFSVAAQQHMLQARATPLTRSTATARITDPAAGATLRGQSPPSPHWSDYSRFPQHTPATTAAGSDAPYAR